MVKPVKAFLCMSCACMWMRGRGGGTLPAVTGDAHHPCHRLLDGWCVTSATECVAWWMPFLGGYGLKASEKDVFGKDFKDSTEKLTC